MLRLFCVKIYILYNHLFSASSNNATTSTCHDVLGNCDLVNRTLNLCFLQPDSARKTCPEFCGLCSIGILNSSRSCLLKCWPIAIVVNNLDIVFIKT